MKTTTELKLEAKDNLRGRWGQAILLNLIPTLLIVGVLIFSTLSGLVWYSTHGTTASLSSFAIDYQLANADRGMGLVSTIISALFMSGISWTYLDLLRKERTAIAPFKDVFRGFQGTYIGGVILLSLLYTIFSSLWMILFLIPGIIKIYAYSQCYFIYYDQVRQTGEKPKVLDTITASRRLMNGHKKRLFWLDITFIGWYLIVALTLGIAGLWIAPYVSATRAAFYKDLQEKTQK
ncbi:DUF975 family protein [Enterococcus sp. AZ196]|uniref:DUF975 family protein n=1 Tax=Enterococcus sp. AZ196 TaxID=2774659 RepID=UPI003D2AB985